MSIAESLVAAIAWTLPGLARERFREEWRADLAGARELELSQWSVVGGAAIAAMTIDRSDPDVTGITKARLIANRMRWAAALLGGAAVLGAGLFLWGGYDSVVVASVGLGIQAIAFLFATLGLLACLGTFVVACDVDGRRTALVLGIGVVAIVAIMAGIVMAGFMVMPVLGMLGVPLLIAVIIVVLSGTRDRSESRELSTSGRITLALPFAALGLLTVAAGVLHITVWNPLAKAPGLSLDEIYAAMTAANETPTGSFIIVWAGFWGAASIGLPILSITPRLMSFFSARRTIVTGLLLVGAAASFHWFAGFNMGMSLADTFMTGGGDAAISGPAIALLGQIALVSAILIGLVPRRYPVEPVKAHLQ